MTSVFKVSFIKKTAIKSTDLKYLQGKKYKDFNYWERNVSKASCLRQLTWLSTRHWWVSMGLPDLWSFRKFHLFNFFIKYVITLNILALWKVFCNASGLDEIGFKSRIFEDNWKKKVTFSNLLRFFENKKQNIFMKMQNCLLRNGNVFIQFHFNV